jgi:hypothetical protein
MQKHVDLRDLGGSVLLLGTFERIYKNVNI